MLTENKPIALNEQENSARLLFIGKCVDENLALPNLAKFGVTQLMTVQDLVNANISTLQEIGKSIKKQMADYDPEFSSSNDGLYIKGVRAEEWIGFIKSTIRKKEFDAWKRSQLNKAKAIKAELETMKSPSQRKKDLQKQLAELEA